MDCLFPEPLSFDFNAGDRDQRISVKAGDDVLELCNFKPRNDSKNGKGAVAVVNALKYGIFPAQPVPDRLGNILIII
jgi:hypothetical protein